MSATAPDAVVPALSSDEAAPGHHRFAGLIFAIASAAAFGMSGPFAKSLLHAGWSPAAAVTGRIVIAALVLLPITVWQMRGRWHLVLPNWRPITGYGLAGVAGAQLAYFSAIQTLSIGVALLLEYTAPLWLVLLAWVTTRRTPHRLVLIGAAASILGLLLVLNVFGGAQLSGAGVMWGLIAAACAAAYFVIASSPGGGLPSLALAGIGMQLGAVALIVAGLTGAVDVHASTAPVHLAGHTTSFIVPLLGIAVISAAFAYVAGVVAARDLGARVASFVALSEVLFAVLFAWLLAGEVPAVIQLVGGLIVISGVVLVRLGESRDVRLAD